MQASSRSLMPDGLSLDLSPAEFADLIAYVTTFMTLKPGDIISTGTPVKKDAKADPPIWLKPGDTVEIECPAIGVLRNSVADEA